MTSRWEKFDLLKREKQIGALRDRMPALGVASAGSLIAERQEVQLDCLVISCWTNSCLGAVTSAEEQMTQTKRFKRSKGKTELLTNVVLTAKGYGSVNDQLCSRIPSRNEGSRAACFRLQVKDSRHVLLSWHAQALA